MGMPQRYFNAVSDLLEELIQRCNDIGDDGLAFSCAMALVEKYIDDNDRDREQFLRRMVDILNDELEVYEHDDD